jgi:hypothetical protein
VVLLYFGQKGGVVSVRREAGAWPVQRETRATKFKGGK